MSLKKLKVNVAPASTKKDSVPTVNIKAVVAKTPQGTFIGPITEETPDNVVINTQAGLQTVSKAEASILPLVQAFNDASVQLDKAQAARDQLEPHLKLMGVSFITSHNCGSPLDPWTSVSLEDQVGDKSRISSTSRYSFANGDLIGATFEAMKAVARHPDARNVEATKEFDAKYDVNEYVQETLVAAFDNKFFLDKDGNFSKARYDAVNAAMDVVAKKLACPNPVSYKTVVLPKPDFHAKRYQLFSVEENTKISAVLPNVVSIKDNVS